MFAQEANPDAVDLLTVSYIAIGASVAIKSLMDEKGSHFDDVYQLHGGHVDIIGYAIQHSGELDAFWESYKNSALSGLDFYRGIAGAFGVSYVHLLNQTGMDSNGLPNFKDVLQRTLEKTLLPQRYALIFDEDGNLLENDDAENVNSRLAITRPELS